METPPDKPATPARSLARKEREAAALRENLRRRKEQARAIAQAAEPAPLSGLPDAPDRV